MDVQLYVGSKPAPPRLRPVRNSHFKPRGGLWTCDYLGPPRHSAWVEWCVENNFGRRPLRGWLLTPRDDARVLVIDAGDLRAFNALPGCQEHGVWQPDFEALASRFDGLRLTGAFLERYRLGLGQEQVKYSLTAYGWDVDSTLWFGWRFDAVAPLGKLEI